MAKRKRQKWDIGDIFIVPQLDGKWSIGQTLVLSDPVFHAVTCGFWDIRCSSDSCTDQFNLPFDKLIACLSVTDEALHNGDWKVIAKQQPLMVEKRYWANEQFRESKWVGSKVYNTPIIDSFLNAFYGLEPWDDYHEPAFLDSLLISPDKKPRNIVLKKKA